MRGLRTGQANPGLLPAVMENGLKRWFRRTAGLVLLTVCAIGWTSFLGWDGRGTEASAGTTGFVALLFTGYGPYFADLLLQTFGFAAPLAMFSPTLWGVELVSYATIENLRRRGSLWLLACLLTAAAAAGLPATLAANLAQGPGGIAGDNLLDMISVPFVAVGFPADSMVIMASAGLLALLLHLQTLGPSWPAASLRLRTRRQALSTGATSGDGKVEPSFDLGCPTIAHAEEEFYEAVIAAQPKTSGRKRTAVAEMPRIEVTAKGRAPAFVAATRIAARLDPHPSMGQADQTPLHVPFEDDPIEDVESQKIARRFAPGTSNGRDRQDDSGLDDSGGGTWWKLRRFLGNAIEEAEAAEQDGFPQPAVADKSEHDAEPEPVASPMGRQLPSLKHLRKPPAPRHGPEHSESALRAKARLLQDVLTEFDVKGTIGEIRPGPVITLFELEPARGVKSARVIGLADDIARSMSATSARIATIPGRNVIGIELPNERRELVVLREILEHDVYRATNATLPIVIGKSCEGSPIIADLARMPHLLIAGTTGSGKSVGVNAMILSLLYRFTAEQCRFIMIDPKMLELSVYNGIPHLLTPVVTDPLKAVDALNWAVNEMEQRYQQMAKLNVRGIEAYNTTVRNARRQGTGLKRTVQTGFDPATGQPRFEKETYDPEPLPYIVIVIDEMADLMMTAGKDFEAAVQRLAQKARAAGIHLITATQRPSVDVITGTIKANLPARLSFRVASKVDSRTILSEQGAEQLLGAGDLLFSPSGSPVRAHAPFIADEEVEAIAAELRSFGAPSHVLELEAPRRDGRAAQAGSQAADGLYQQALAIVERDGKASTSYLQRRLSIGYNRAADLIERLEAAGVITAADPTGRRQVLSRRAASA